MRTAPYSRSAVARKRLIAVASTIVGVALTAAMAGPASAAPPPTSPPPALSAWLADSSVTSSAAPAAPTSSALASPTLVKPASIVGKRTTFTRGSSLAWASDTFEWYWSGSSLTSSTGWQADGYIFPNTVTLQGVTRTLAIPSQHNWRGSATIGAGIVTPWGAVDVYQTSVTDYFSLTPGGGFSHSS